MTFFTRNENFKKNNNHYLVGCEFCYLFGRQYVTNFVIPTVISALGLSNISEKKITSEIQHIRISFTMSRD